VLEDPARALLIRISSVIACDWIEWETFASGLEETAFPGPPPFRLQQLQ